MYLHIVWGDRVLYTGAHTIVDLFISHAQDPVLVSGTLKMNLDPFDSYSVMDLWHALDKAHLAGFVTSSPRGLLHPITEYGDNLR